MNDDTPICGGRTIFRSSVKRKSRSRDCAMEGPKPELVVGRGN
jgi:hypothetical protein